MKKQQQSVTSLPRSPEDERRTRMIKYLIVMGIRIVCLIAVFFVLQWWWAVALCAAGAIVLPYIAVIIANQTMNTGVAGPERPGAVQVYRMPPAGFTPPPADGGRDDDERTAS
ncbi:DUF3099 domain-containing protein [Humibacter sp. BT305]|nr:DUF3099 domain-containing protein [Humibacter sp. BT305]